MLSIKRTRMETCCPSTFRQTTSSSPRLTSSQSIQWRRKLVYPCRNRWTWLSRSRLALKRPQPSIRPCGCSRSQMACFNDLISSQRSKMRREIKLSGSSRLKMRESVPPVSQSPTLRQRLRLTWLRHRPRSMRLSSRWTHKESKKMLTSNSLDRHTKMK